MLQKIGSFILYTLLIIVSIASISISTYFLFKVVQSYRWMETEAEVKAAVLKTIKSSKSISEKAEISYQYVIDEKTYEGNEVCLGHNSVRCRSDEALILQKANSGNKIRVFVNPNDFNESVIVQGFSFHIFAILFVTLFVNFISALFLSEIIPILKHKTFLGFGSYSILFGILFIMAFRSGYFNFNTLAKDIVVLENK